jgi:hypothetical protein
MSRAVIISAVRTLEGRCQVSDWPISTTGSNTDTVVAADPLSHASRRSPRPSSRILEQVSDRHCSVHRVLYHPLKEVLS